MQYHKEVSTYYVPQALQKGQVFILPSKSDNFGHTIYEALSTGFPLITSVFTPWNGLEAQHAGINVSNSVAGIRGAIRLFAAVDDRDFKKCSEGAVALAVANSNPDLIKAQYDVMFAGSNRINQPL